MSAAKAIAPDVIAEASQKLAEEDGLAKRLEWWLLGGHSAERWVQFEWAFSLDDVVKRKPFGPLRVLCELGRVDIGIVGSDPETLWEEEPVAGIELKWWGNWCITDHYHLTNLKVDLNKVNDYGFPAAAVILFLEAKHERMTKHHQWIGRQRERVGGVDELNSRISSRVDKVNQPREISRIAINSSLVLSTLAYHNQHAR